MCVDLLGVSLSSPGVRLAYVRVTAVSTEDSVRVIDMAAYGVPSVRPRVDVGCQNVT